MQLGAHVSTAGGLSTCVPRAQALGAECMQIFLCAPQRWQLPKHTDEQVHEFGRLVGEAGIGPNYAHATYLVNLAAGDPLIRQKSIDNLSACATWADRVGLAGIVVHVGSGRGQSVEEAEAQVASSLEEVLARGVSGSILLENSAGSGEYLGSRFQQIGNLLEHLGRDQRLGLCLDTAHTFASGYDLRVDDGIQRAVDEVAEFIGIERLKLIHANDSKVGLSSAVDRHENIGKGQLGEDAFRRLLAHSALAPVAWVLEVPGYDDKGPDKPNLDDLKRLARRT
ncbi:MAG: deoxyribonuclease IV [Chloroflexi bacterium]|nr:deoxyribonuclease IV [Chloroflexota bacterium]MBV9599132.1 deoxyribonuclease IV [Chloroflexota bacterium]